LSYRNWFQHLYFVTFHLVVESCIYFTSNTMEQSSKGAGVGSVNLGRPPLVHLLAVVQQRQPYRSGKRSSGQTHTACCPSSSIVWHGALQHLTTWQCLPCQFPFARGQRSLSAPRETLQLTIKGQTGFVCPLLTVCLMPSASDRLYPPCVINMFAMLYPKKQG
jgi:hypothetical protein